MTDYYQQQYEVPTAGTRNPDDLTSPLYGATFGQALRRFFASYLTSAGRASRSEFWWVALAAAGVSAVGIVLIAIGNAITGDDGSGAAMFPTIIGVVVLLVSGFVFGLGSICLTIRRLHDINASGWWYLPIFLLGPIPLVGFLVYIAIIVIGVLPSNPAGIRFDSRS
ncbi:DUF805 domain-containing protein [Tsukamurella sp. DT100]|uniref:DUF805 domain-containing protein n=1 Tax=Tsukamurella sp. DT100 TaxID=3393415 RepID=UPI003CF07E2E